MRQALRMLMDSLYTVVNCCISYNEPVLFIKVWWSKIRNDDDDNDAGDDYDDDDVDDYKNDNDDDDDNDDDCW